MTPAGNPLASDNSSLEAARARELAELVHTKKLGAHTDHHSDDKQKVFDLQQPTPHTQVTPTNPLQQTTHPSTAEGVAAAGHARAAAEQTSLTDAARAILTQAKIEPLAPPAPSATPTSTATTEAPSESAPQNNPIERINQNQSLVNQSAVLHTLQQDVQSLIRDRKVSMVRAAALEQDAQPLDARFANTPTQPRSLGKTLSILAVLLLFCAGAVMVWSYYTYLTKPREAAEEIRKARYDTALVFYEHTQPFDTTDLAHYELLGGLAHVRDSIPSSLGSMTHIDMFEKTYDPSLKTYASVALPLDRFLSQGDIELPASLLSALTGEFMVLVHQSTRPIPAVLLRTNNAQAAFAGMLTWEKLMSLHLSPFFPRGTLTLAESVPEFSDWSLHNIDMRVLKDGNGSIILLYAILERDVVAITSSEITMQEIANRLHTQRLKK